MDPQILAILMVVSLFTLILAGVPVAFAIAGAGLFFGAIGVDMNLFNLLPARIFGVLTNYTLLAVPLFVFMGILLEKSRIAEKMLDVLGLLSGKKPGGMAIAIIVVGILMGASTGIVGATVVTLTMISLPTLLRRNYSHSVSCGTICASGTLGQILPPSLVLILLADISGEAIGPLFAAALVPGLLLACMYILYIVFLSWFFPQHVPPIDIEERESYSRKELYIEFIKSVAPPFILIFAVLGSIIGGLAAPTEAASMGAIGSLVIVFLSKRLSMEVLRETLYETMKVTGMIMFVLLASQIFGLSFRGLEGDYLVEDLFAAIPGGMWGSIIFMMFVLFVLGFFLEWIEISYIVLPLVLPIFHALDINMIWLGILVALNLQTSFLTPPFGWSLFFLKGVAPKEIKTMEIYKGVLPFIAIQIFVIGLVMLFPDIALWLPKAIGWM
ncbi:TRAP dicarboxylate transporter, DctM subunit [Arcobacter nitrofigilis DSM 7299]|uniref:TRAP dicarboxylate transporter, DctM subunit n=2 Tax=Arcobacter TaxID=28196 RepID=D5V4D5_ARCNC|nr:TRAP transporter large permease subunit [Arcobacter nitrofigilis]ADG91868.1 TRAP dicarboxylate transporter, DctM subunit [Arcobacter nitrofigilis DSM 7299]